MLTFLGGLVVFANLHIGSAQGPANRPPDPSVATPIAAPCCDAAPAPAPPPPQGTNKGLLPEPMILTSLVDAIVSKTKNEGDVKSGPYIKFGAGVPGAVWIAAGPGYRRLFNERLLFDVSAAVSWRQYLDGRARLELRPFANTDLTLGAQVLGQDWTQRQYFGVGPDSRQDDRSSYRLRATDVSAYAVVSPGTVFDLRVRVGMLHRPRISRASGWHRRNIPDTQSLFTDESTPGLTAQPRFFHTDVAVSVDTLDHPDHPTRGLLLELSHSHFDDKDLNLYNFRRYELTTVGVLPLIGNLWTMGVRGTVIASRTSGVNQVPFYMLPSLGQTRLRGFETDRFHDRDMIAFSVESRWAIFQHLDAALFADFGQVAPVFSALNRKDFESSAGVGLRLHTGAATFLRLDAARAAGGGGGWSVTVKLNDSLSFSKARSWATVVPVVR